MAWKLRLIENPKEKKYDDFEPGDYWYAPWYISGDMKEIHKLALSGDKYTFLSRRYIEQDMEKRAPVIIRLPNGADWLIDAKASNGPGWDITGEFPNVTARPSILSGTYHGWLTDGVLSDDIEGRTYDHAKDTD